MSFAEVKELLPTFSDAERTELRDCICAFEEGVSVEEYQAMRSAINEALIDSAPTCSLEDLEADLEKLTRSDGAAV